MSRPFLVLIVLVLLAAGTIAVLFSGGDARVPVAAGSGAASTEGLVPPASVDSAEPETLSASEPSRKELPDASKQGAQAPDSEAAPPEEATGFTGRVLDAAGRPAASVRVLAERGLVLGETLPDGVEATFEPGGENPFVRFETSTDAAGRFLLVGLPPTPHGRSAGWRIRCLAPGAVAGTLTGPLRRSELRDLGDLGLRPAASLSGQVVSEAGVPIAGALVTWGSLPDEGSARTDERGRFLLSPIPPGRKRVRVYARGWVQPRPPVVAVGPGERAEGLLLTVVPARPLEVKVTDGRGRPLPGVHVRVYGRAGEGAAWLTISGQTDADGLVRLEDVPPGGVFVVATTPWGQGSAGVPEGADRVEVSIGSEARLRGTVRSAADRSPISGAHVGWRFTWSPSGEQRPESFVGREAPVRTDDEGRFALALPSLNGAVEIWAYAPGFELAAPPAVRLEGAEPPPVVLDLRPATPVDLLVQDPAGRPVEDAVVAVRPAGGRNGGGRELTRVTDRAGKVRFDTLPPAAYEVRAQKDGFAPAHAHFVLERGKPRHLTLALAEGGVLEVDVRDGSGSPAPDVLVVAESAQGDVRRRRSGPDGLVRFVGLAAGRWRAEARAPGLEDEPSSPDSEEANVPPAERFPIEIADGQTRRVLRVVDLRPAGRLAGRVLVDGRPGSAVTLRLRPAVGLSGREPRPALVVRPDAQGRFFAGGLRPGRYLLRPVLDDDVQWTPVLLDVFPGRETRRDLDLGTTSVRGSVVGADGRPIGECEVSLDVQAGPEDPGGWLDSGVEVWTEADGSFSMEEVPEGRVRLRANQHGLREAEPVVLDIRRGRPVEDVLLRLVEGGWLAVRLDPFPDQTLLEVSARDEEGHESSRWTYGRPADGLLWVDARGLGGRVLVEVWSYGADGKRTRRGAASLDLASPGVSEQGNLQVRIDLRE